VTPPLFFYLYPPGRPLMEGSRPKSLITLKIMENILDRKIASLMEVETSVKLLKKGMGDLQNIGSANDFYHAPILLLSSGYERLMKCLLCLAFMDENMNPTEKAYYPKGRKGHDLTLLLKKLIEVCEKKGYSSKFPKAKEDIELLSKDEDLRKIVTLLSDFAQGGRYYNLDIVLYGTSTYKDPTTMYQKIERAILQKRNELSKKLTEGDTDYVHREINRELIITLEKFTRALSRLFTLADFGDFAKQASALVYDYLMLRDDDLGTRDYRILQATFK
jgi:hypothetical protein